MCKNIFRMGLSATLCLVAALLPLASHAQSVDDWKWQATIYGWFPSLSGKTSFPPGTGGPSIDIDADTITDSLEFVFMGSIEAHRGKWGIWTDLVYVDLEAAKSGTRDATIGRQAIPVGAGLNAEMEIKGLVWTIAGTYSVISTPEHSMQVLAGARMIDLEEKLNWQFTGNISALPLAASGSSTVEDTLWDAIVGIKGRASFGANREWFVPYYLDIGTGQSDFTWQGIIGIGYQFHWGAVTAAWRYLDYEFKSGNSLESLNLNGPAIGVTLRW